MGNTDQSPIKSTTSQLHAVNLIVALLAGMVSIVGGVYTIKNNFFPSQSYGILQGIVRDAKLAKPLLLAGVEVSTPDGAVINTAKTDEDGRYVIETLKTGNYVVKVEAPRHTSQTKKVKIEKGITSSINVDLVPIEEPAVISPPAERPLPTAVRNIPAQNTQLPATTASQYQVPVPTAQVPSGTGSYPGYGEPSADTYPNPQYRRHRRPHPGQIPQTGYDAQIPTGETGTASFPGPTQGDSYGTDSPQTSGSTVNSALTQAGIQLVQQLLKKKSSEDSSTTASN